MNMSEQYLKLKEQNERHKERCKKYHQDHKEEHKERCKANYYKNHEENLQIRAAWRQDEDYKLMMERYRKSEAGKKSARISNWKKMGLKSDDYNLVYDDWKSATHCEECNIELIEGNTGKNKKVLDHDHNTGLSRAVICNSCNIIRGNDDRGVVRQTNEMYNENRNMARKVKKFKLKWAFEKLIYQIISQ